MEKAVPLQEQPSQSVYIKIYTIPTKDVEDKYRRCK
jgi:hypothetical protein